MRDRQPLVRRRAAGALAQIADTRATGSLIDALHDTYTRDIAVGALARLRDPRVIEPMIDALKCPYDDERERMVEALASLGTLARAPLIWALNDRDRRVRWEPRRSSNA